MRNLLLASATGALAFAIWAAQAQPVPGLLDDMEQPPAGYSGPLFQPSYDFPAAMPAPEPRPWEAIDYEAEPAKFMEALLLYFLEGQDRGRWTVGSNSVRKWYHMPWMGPGGTGREFVSGLTSERRSRPGELGPNQAKCRQNWAVGFYNPVGGHALGQIWSQVAAGQSDEPDLSKLPFPVGTVVAKVLYTEADENDTRPIGQTASLLAGAPTIEARIIEDPDPADTACPQPEKNGKPAPRVATTLRLLQLDIAVKLPNPRNRSEWVFGTFIYDGRLPGSDPWTKLRPVGVMWGNDPGLSDQMAASGTKPASSIVLSDFGLGRAFGRGNRLNGPVDNPKSSCLSCHSTAQSPSGAPMAPGENLAWDKGASCWFRDLDPVTAFGKLPTATQCGVDSASLKSLDYSLQLALGVRNARIAAANRNPGGINLFGLRLFGRPEVRTDRVETIDGVRSFPVTRDED